MSDIITWQDLELYIAELRERVILEIGDAPSDFERTKAQGKLALCNELVTLRESLDTMAKQAQEGESRGPRPFARTDSFRKIQLARARPASVAEGG